MRRRNVLWLALSHALVAAVAWGIASGGVSSRSGAARADVSVHIDQPGEGVFVRPSEVHIRAVEFVPGETPMEAGSAMLRVDAPGKARAYFLIVGKRARAR